MSSALPFLDLYFYFVCHISFIILITSVLPLFAIFVSIYLSSLFYYFVTSTLLLLWVLVLICLSWLLLLFLFHYLLLLLGIIVFIYLIYFFNDSCIFFLNYASCSLNNLFFCYPFFPVTKQNSNFFFLLDKIFLKQNSLFSF